jgi:methyl-accepting chemotaxis protein
MKWLYEIKLKNKVFLNNIIAILFLLIIVLISILNNHNTLKGMETLYLDRIIPLEQLKQVSDLYAVNIVDATHKTRSKKFTNEEGLKTIELAESQINTIWNQYLTTYLVKEEIEIIEEIKPLIKRVNNSIADLKDILKNNDTKALNYYVEELMYPEFDPLTDNISNLINLQLKISKQVYDKTESDYYYRILIYSILIIIFIIIYTIIGTLISKILLNQIGGEPKIATSIAYQILNRDFTTQIQLDPKDKISMMYALNNIIDSFSEIILQIKTSSDQMLQSSTQLSESSQTLAMGSSQQASSTEQITSALTQIEAQSVQNSDLALSASNLSKDVYKNAQRGSEEMNGLQNSMDELNTSSEKISKIVKEIEIIAFQTNILALNAAVEAARSGQHGKGFNVVATEIRNLAIRSSNSAKETSSLIEETIQKIKEGTKISSRTSDTLKTIVNGVTTLTELVGAISVSSEEQKLGISQINLGINEISLVTMSNAAASEQMASASEELTGQAVSFNEMVSGFKLKEIIPKYSEPTIKPVNKIIL